ncbi:GGDEF domain-containing protein [Vibrio sp. HN007]|uniref:GGDEF domain-containing protein n=1 Tax=Vibrio iocasae TaxID=3098914 RepID=UPI0035D4CF5A
MSSGLAYFFTSLFVALTMATVAFLLPEKRNDRRSRLAFRVYFVSSVSFYVSIISFITFEYVLFETLGDVALAVGQAALVVGIAWHCQLVPKKNYIFGAAIVYFLIDQISQEYSILAGYIYSLVTHAASSWLLVKKKELNLGDYGMLATLSTWSLFQIVTITSLIGSFDFADFDIDITTSVFVVAPAFIAALGIFLITSNLLDTCLQLEIEATTDPLTGKFNRRAFSEFALKEISTYRRTNSSLSMVIMDIDFFKKINDKYGHDIGDLVIKKTADTVAEVIREEDILARFGGEEFVILLPRTDLKDAANVAERMRQNIENIELDTEKGRVTLTASFGVANFDINHDLDDTLRRADQSLYKAKSEGRNQVVSSGS